MPQGRHAHGLLARGGAVIEEFFPGWTNEVVAGGGLFGDIANDVTGSVTALHLKSGPSDLADCSPAGPARRTSAPKADGAAERAR